MFSIYIPVPPYRKGKKIVNLRRVRKIDDYDSAVEIASQHYDAEVWQITPNWTLRCYLKIGSYISNTGPK
jgi:hypothetical protein